MIQGCLPVSPGPCSLMTPVRGIDLSVQVPRWPLRQRKQVSVARPSPTSPKLMNLLARIDECQGGRFGHQRWTGDSRPTADARGGDVSSLQWLIGPTRACRAPGGCSSVGVGSCHGVLNQACTRCPCPSFQPWAADQRGSPGSSGSRWGRADWHLQRRRPSQLLHQHRWWPRPFKLERAATVERDVGARSGERR